MSWGYLHTADNNYKLLIIIQLVDAYLNEAIKIDELIKLANQWIHESIGDRKFLKANSKFVVWSIETKKKQKLLGFDLRKRYIKGKKHIAQIENHIFRRSAKFIIVDFYEIDFSKGILIYVKVDEMHKILKSLLTHHFWSRVEGVIGWSILLLEPVF